PSSGWTAADWTRSKRCSLPAPPRASPPPPAAGSSRAPRSFLQGFVDRRDLHSFPTRRSSDLRRRPGGRHLRAGDAPVRRVQQASDRKSTRLNSSYVKISYAVFCLKKKKTETERAKAVGTCRASQVCLSARAATSKGPATRARR